MCQGLASIAVRQSDGSWKGYVKPQNGSHDQLLSENCPECHDHALRFEIFYPGTIQWDRPDSIGLEALQKNGIVGSEGLGNIPLAPMKAVEAIVLVLKDIDASWWAPKILQKANLQEANLHEANLRGANLRGANLHEANLQRADLEGQNKEDLKKRGAAEVPE